MARRIDTFTLQIRLKISFIVLDFLSKTHSSRSLYEVIMALFKYFKILKHIKVFSCCFGKLHKLADWKRLTKMRFKKQLKSINEPKPKGKDNAMVIIRDSASRNCQMEYCPWGKICSKEIWRSRVNGSRNYPQLWKIQRWQ